MILLLLKKNRKQLRILKQWEFPGSTVVRTWHFHCCGLGSIPGRGAKILQAAACRKKKKKKKVDEITVHKYLFGEGALSILFDLSEISMYYFVTIKTIHLENKSTVRAWL